jgi:hypothetical protein
MLSRLVSNTQTQVTLLLQLSECWDTGMCHYVQLNYKFLNSLQHVYEGRITRIRDYLYRKTIQDSAAKLCL